MIEYVEIRAYVAYQGRNKYRIAADKMEKREAIRRLNDAFDRESNNTWTEKPKILYSKN